MLRLRPLAVLLSLSLALCLLGLWSARSQTGALRRVTNTTEDGVNVNPSLSGDGRRVSFESTKDLAGAGGNGFHALRADLSSDPATFIQMGVTRAPAPGISQDGSSIAFASKDDPLGTNPDGNSEIFLYAGTTLRQITNTTPSSPQERTRQGNFQPSLTDDGRFIAFSSNRNPANQNADGNLEIFIFDTSSSTFTQLTNTSGVTGATDAKISGDGTRVAYIRDTNATPAAQRDLLLQDRSGANTRILASNVTNLAFTYGRAISDDGQRVVYSGDIAPNSSQVFLFDGRTTNTTRQITTLGVREQEVPLHPTISGDGRRIAFATRRPMPVVDNDADNSIDLFTYDIPTGQFARVTDAPSTADGFDGSNRAAEVVSSLSDDGSIIAFNFPRSLSDDVDTDFDNNSEIYVTGTAVRPSVGQLTILNGASFGHEPATTEAVAPDSIAVARGGALSFTTERTQRQADGSFPRTAGGTTVTVNGRSAQIFYVSPEQVNFHVPAETELGTAEVVVTNIEGFQSRGTIQVLRAAPGIFTTSGDGVGEGMILNADTLQPGPFDPSSGNLRLVIFATGVRKATQVTATAGGRALTVESVMQTPNMPGMDEVRVLVPADLRGVGKVDLVIRADARDSNPVVVEFTGDTCRDIVINEVLADPPDGLAGDANRDGVRDSGDDEFVELVNRTGQDKDISGYQLTARSSTASTDTVRHTFAPGTIFPSGAAIVVFGGGNPNPSDPAFGGALILKASSGGLSLTNSGGFITLRQPSQDIVNIFSYGGSTGLNGDANQSLTRSPDAGVNSECATFVLHSTAPNSGGRPFSPGTHTNGTPFATNTIARIEVSPTSATIDAGAKQQFTATAYDASNNVVTGIIFFWQSSNTAVATIDQTGLATGVSAGTTEIRASAHGVQSAPASLTVRDVVRVLTRVEVTPNPATIPVGGTQQFTARGFDQFDNEILGLTFTWESTNTSVATVDQTGLANGVSQGQTTIRATSQGVSGTATLNVTPPTIIINEVLADPPDGLAGDANHDGVRDSGDDEFVELVNSTGGGINISGWTVRTRATSGGTETVRHTFVTSTTLPAGEAIVVFGGGNPDPANAIFACAQVVKASSASGLSLTNSGLTVVVRDSAGNLVTQFTYGGSTGLNGDSNQSLTRSPDITGSFTLHTTASGANGRRFSPGTKVNGSPFGSCPSRLTSVTISPPSSSITTGQTTQFTAQAFDQFGNPITGATITFVSDNTTVATIESVTTDSNTGIATATVRGNNPGTANITAQASDGTTTVTSSPATLTVNASLPTVSIDELVVTEGDSGTKTATFNVTLSTSSTQTVTVGYATSSASPATATAGTDYQSTSGTLTFNPGETTKPINVIINGDTLVEVDETFFVNLSGATNAIIADGQGQAIIINDDTANLVISQVYGGGNNSGAAYQHDFIEIFNRGTTTVDFSITHYSVQYASAGANFGGSKTDLTSGVIAPGHYFLIQEAGGTTNGAPLPTPDAIGTIAMGNTSGKVALVANTTASLPAAICPGDDGTPPFNPNDVTIADFIGYGSVSCYEGANPAPAPSNTTADFRKAGGCQDTNNNVADFFVFAPNPRNSASPVNNCSASLAPNLTISDATVTEGNSGTVTATFTVSLSAPANGADVTFDISTQNNTALSGSDYVARSLTNQIIPAGQQTYTFSVIVNGDTAVEPDETFFVNVTNVAGANVTDGQGVGTIQNDDLPTLSINDVTHSEGNSATTFTFTVSLSAPAPANVTFDIATADGTAQDGTPSGEDNDYVARSLTGQSIPAGQQTFNFDVTVNGDSTVEPDETFFVNVTNISGATAVDTQGMGTIQNDDSPPSPIVASVVVTPSPVTINRGRTQQFTATAFDPSNQPVPSATFTWSSSNTAVATVDSNGLATGVGIGTTTITATTSDGMGGNVSGTATLNVQVPLVINEILADVVADNPATTNVVEGDANRDGVRSSDDDEFVELINNSSSQVDISGVVISDSTSNRFTFPANTTLAAGRAVVIFGGGSPPINDPAFGGSLILTTTSLGLNDSGSPADTVTVKLNVGGSDVVIASVTYGGAGNPPAPSDQSLTRSPDAEINSAGGNFVAHNTATNAAGRVFSPGTRADGTPFGSPAITRIEVLPASASINIGATQAFTATAYSNVGGPEVAVPNVSFIWDSSDPTKATVAPTTGTTTTATGVAAGSSTIRAQAGGQQGTAALTINAPLTLSINDVTHNEGNSGPTTYTFTVSLSAIAPAAVTFDIATQDNTATVADSDYVAKSLTGQSIPAGQQTYTFDVTVNGDTNVEPNETFFVNATNVSGATVADGQGVGTIQNDDSAPAPEANLSITKTDSPDPMPSGANLTYTLTVTNNSATTAAQAVTVTDNLPADVVFVSCTSVSGNGTCGGSGNTRTVTFTSIAGNASETITLVARVLHSAAGTTISNTASVSATTSDPDTGNNSATQMTVVTLPPLAISYVYGGGGANTGTPSYTRDFVEIFNRGAVAITLSGLSLQQGATTGNIGGNAGQIYSLCPGGAATCTLNPGQYYLVETGTTGTAGAPLSATVTPDDTGGTLTFAATNGKAALVIGTTGLACGATATLCSATQLARVVDLVGYGTGTTQAEGNSPTGNLSTTLAARRKGNGCTDTNVNSADFDIVTPTGANAPRNMASALNVCP